MGGLIEDFRQFKIVDLNLDPGVERMLVLSINLRFLKKRKVCLESSPRSDILDSVKSLVGGPARFILK